MMHAAVKARAKADDIPIIILLGSESSLEGSSGEASIFSSLALGSEEMDGFSLGN